MITNFNKFFLIFFAFILFDLISSETLNDGLITKEKYDILKKEAKFELMSYEKYIEIFGGLDLSNRKKYGDLTYKQEIDFLKEKKYGEVYSPIRDYTVPSTYDCRSVFPDCFDNIIRDQLNCGGCW